MRVNEGHQRQEAAYTPGWMVVWIPSHMAGSWVVAREIAEGYAYFSQRVRVMVSGYITAVTGGTLAGDASGGKPDSHLCVCSVACCVVVWCGVVIHACICVYVCMCVCVYVCMCVCVYVYMCIFVSVYLCICVYVYMCICVYVCKCVSV